MLKKTEVSMIFPRFVMHNRYDEGEEFNKELHRIACEHNLANRPDATDENKAHSRHLNLKRCNMLQDVKSPVVRRLIEMYAETARKYLRTVYHYDHTGDFEFQGDTFYQRKSHGENLGIMTHTHLLAQLVVTYYPRVDRDDTEKNAVRRGAVRFYDPQIVNTRHWPNNNPHMQANSWFNVEPEVGSMLAFEGHMPHDSTFFDGDERMCIPCLIGVVTPRSHMKISYRELLRCQDQP